MTCGQLVPWFTKLCESYFFANIKNPGLKMSYFVTRGVSFLRASCKVTSFSYYKSSFHSIGSISVITGQSSIVMLGRFHVGRNLLWPFHHTIGEKCFHLGSLRVQRSNCFAEYHCHNDHLMPFLVHSPLKMAKFIWVST